MAKVLKAIVLALILAVLLAVIGAILAGEGQENALFAIFFWVGLIGFSVLFLKVQRVGFWFCLSYAVEWTLLPIAAAINTTQPVKETGCAGIVAAIGTVLLLAITVPVGAIGCSFCWPCSSSGRRSRPLPNRPPESQASRSWKGA